MDKNTYKCEISLKFVVEFVRKESTPDSQMDFFDIPKNNLVPLV
jgi:hypothetical protein